MGKKKLAKRTEGENGTSGFEGVEIFATGTWLPEGGGEVTVTEADLDEIALNFDLLAGEVNPSVRIGHIDTVEGGLPAPRFGTLQNVAREGGKLLADFLGLPGKVADIIEGGGYPRVSVELFNEFTTAAGEKLKNVLDSAVLLGSDQPAVGTLADIVALYEGQEALVTYAADRADKAIARYERTSKEAFGILADAVEEEERESKARELTWTANRLIDDILHGHGDFENLGIPMKKVKIGEVLDDLEIELAAIADETDEPEGTPAVEITATEGFESARTTESRKAGAGHEEEEMTDEQKEKLARAEKERDQFKQERDTATTENTTLKAAAAEQDEKARLKTAETDAAEFFESAGVKDRILPAERAIAEPMMVALMTTQDSEAPVTFSHGTGEEKKDLDLVAGMRALFEARKAIDPSIFKAELDRDIENQPGSGGTAVETATGKAQKIVDESDGKIEFRSAMKTVRKDDPALAKEMDKERHDVGVMGGSAEPQAD